MNEEKNLADLAAKFSAGDRQALAKIITLVESTNPSHKIDVSTLLDRIHRPAHATIRVAISGPPGVGKSTFINTVGQKICARGFKLAILAIDPSSDIRFGSVLADKTRMKSLLSREDVYVRPSPSKGALGGLSFSTHDVLYVVEAFGFDFVVVETVGVGQSEIFARELADHFVVLMQPGAGDQLQAMKKGIIERADFILVNKSDGEQQALAKTTLASLKSHASHGGSYLHDVSALNDSGVDEFLDALLTRHQQLVVSEALSRVRAEKRVALVKRLVAEECAQRLLTHKTTVSQCEHLARDEHAQDRALGPLISPLVDDIMNKFS